jgi:hypothetical protein
MAYICLNTQFLVAGRYILAIAIYIYKKYEKCRAAAAAAAVLQYLTVGLHLLCEKTATENYFAVLVKVFSNQIAPEHLFFNHSFV